MALFPGLEDRIAGQRNYWSQVAESDGFDITDVIVPKGTTGLLPFNCQRRRYRLRSCVPKLYAMAGLHCYNMLMGTHLEYASLLKYNKTMNCVASYFLTLVAQDLSSQSGKINFQVRVDEKKYGVLNMTVSIARPKDEEVKVTTKKSFIPHFHGEAKADDFYKGKLPPWPSVNDFNDQKRFYLVKNPELADNDWIALYMELALCVDDIKITERMLSQLKILKVAIETKEEVQPPNERLKAKCANVYITFKGLAKGSIGKDVERNVIVRRVIDERTGYLTLKAGFPTQKEASVSGQGSGKSDVALENN
ncbi:unnamed protein product [Cochlearia groenlandica]